MAAKRTTNTHRPLRLAPKQGRGVVSRTAATGQFVTVKESPASPKTKVTYAVKHFGKVKAKPITAEKLIRFHKAAQVKYRMGGSTVTVGDKTWTDQDMELVMRLAEAAKATRVDPGENITNLSDADFLKRLFG